MQRIEQEDLQHILSNTESLWGQLENKSIFITGATGFFGKWLLESFLYINKKFSLNASVCALSRNPDAFFDKFPFYKDETSVTFIKGDILNFDFPNRSFQFIIHAATDADAKLNNENPLLMLDTITAGTRRILDFAKTQPLESFLLTSSGAVYGKQPEKVTHIKEDQGFKIDINNPSSAYAEGKRVAELYCSIYHKQYKVPVKIARCFAFVGPYLPLNKHFAIGNFIYNSLEKEDITIKGDGTPYRSYMYAADLTIWIWRILFKGQNNIPYNIGSSEGLDLKTIAEKVAALSPNTKVNILGSYIAGSSVERYVPSTEFMKNEMGLQLTVSLTNSIKKTISFYKKHNKHE